MNRFFTQETFAKQQSRTTFKNFTIKHFYHKIFLFNKILIGIHFF